MLALRYFIDLVPATAGSPPPTSFEDDGELPVGFEIGFNVCGKVTKGASVYAGGALAAIWRE
jgi:hypothetical protein